jgi:pimeloyl-ACP methyl ester carboxylesterase
MLRVTIQEEIDMQPRLQKYLVAILSILFLFDPSRIAAQSNSDPVSQDLPVDHVYPATSHTVAVPSGGVFMNGLLYIAQGVGPHPTAILLHGFPGDDRDLDLAQTLRRAGWNVLAFQYRGAWGSEGSYSFSNTLQDASAAVTFVKGLTEPPSRVDTGKVVLIGRSMGGFAALLTAARDPRVRTVVAVAPLNAGRRGKVLRDGAAYSAYVTRVKNSLRPLDGTTAEQLANEQIANAQAWDLTTLGPQLARKNVLLLGGTRDQSAPIAENHEPIAAALTAANATRLKAVLLDTDHGFSDKRVTLARTIVGWLEKLGDL